MEYAGQTPESPSKEADESGLKQLREQLYWIRVTRAKLLMDLIFVCESTSSARQTRVSNVSVKLFLALISSAGERLFKLSLV
jgi:hypothetical protein